MHRHTCLLRLWLLSNPSAEFLLPTWIYAASLSTMPADQSSMQEVA